MQGDHGRVVALAGLDAAHRHARGARCAWRRPARRAARERRARSSARYHPVDIGSPLQQDELGAEPGTHREHHGRLARCRRAWSSSVSASTCSTEADDRLPIAASERRVGARASASEPERRGDGVDHLGAAGMATQCRTSADVEVVGVEERLHVVAEVRRDHVGDPGGEHDAQAAAADVPAHDPRRCRGRSATCCRSREARRPSAAARRSADQDDRARRRRRTARWPPGAPVTCRRAAASASRARRPAARRRRRGARRGSRAGGPCRRLRPRSPGRTAASA